MKTYQIFLFTTLFLSSSFLMAQEQMAIRHALQANAEAWNRGSVRDFMSFYADEDSVLFLSKKGPSFGHANILAKYLKQYPDTASMGHLNYEVYKVRQLSPQSAYMAGSWALKRKAGNLGGVFLLVWQKQKGVWKIVADHTE